MILKWFIKSDSDGALDSALAAFLADRMNQTK